MGQFMNRADGIRALHEAAEALSRASAALHEREGGRESLIGATSEIIGGLGQAVQALADQIVDGVSEMEESEVLAPSMFSALVGAPEIKVDQVWTGITGNRLVIREVKDGRARLSYEDDPGDETWEDVEDIRTAFTLATPRVTQPDENSPGAILVDAVHEQWLAEGTE